MAKYHSIKGVLFFKRILNFSKETVVSGDKRQAPRYAAGHPFPFKTVLTLVGHDGEGHMIPGNDKTQDWSGRLTNISATGASIQVHSAAVTARGEPCHFKFTLDSYLLDIPSTVAYFRSFSQYSLCGFSFNFPDFDTQKAYLQILEPVSIGASLTVVDPKEVKQDTAGLHKEEYRGDASSRLTVWRDAPGGTIHSFDLRMNKYGVRWSAGMNEIDTYGLGEKPPGKKGTRPAVSGLTEEQQEEVRWLFCLAVPNLPKGVPSDVRKFFAQLVALRHP